MVSSSSPSPSHLRRGPPPVFSKGNTRKLPCDGLVGGVPAAAASAEACPGKRPSITIAHSMRKEIQVLELRTILRLIVAEAGRKQTRRQFGLAPSGRALETTVAF